MKLKETFSRCEYCNDLLSEEYPLPEQDYVKGRISLGENSDVLLDNFNNPTSSPPKDIAGEYCNIYCLINHLKTIRGEKRK